MSERYLIASSNDDGMHPDGYHRVIDSKANSIVGVIDDYAIAKGMTKKLNNNDNLAKENAKLHERCTSLVSDKVELIKVTESLIDAVNELNYRLSFTAKPQGFTGWVDIAKKLLDKFN